MSTLVSEGAAGSGGCEGLKCRDDDYAESRGS